MTELIQTMLNHEALLGSINKNNRYSSITEIKAFRIKAGELKVKVTYNGKLSRFFTVKVSEDRDGLVVR